MTPTIHPDLYGDLIEVASRTDFAAWQGMVRSIRGCAEPVQLWGHSCTLHAGTGEVLSQREPGRLLVACGNRRRARCPSCSETYRADTFHLIKAGLVGGKSVPDSVAERRKVFATFTAPSFGPVHHRTVGTDGKVRRCHPRGPVYCRRRHRRDDRELGEPLDAASYDYVRAVIWNAPVHPALESDRPAGQSPGGSVTRCPSAGVAGSWPGIGGQGSRVPSTRSSPLPRHLPPGRPRARRPTTSRCHHRVAL
jgi:hypothetical protein